MKRLGLTCCAAALIGEADSPSSQLVAVINEAFAHRYFPKEDAMHKHFGLGNIRNSQDYEIVGIVGDAKYQDARGPAYPTFFMPFLQQTKDSGLSWLVESQYIGAIELSVAGKPENLEAVVRRTLAEIDPNLTVTDVVSMREQVTQAQSGNADRPAHRTFRRAGLDPGLCGTLRRDGIRCSPAHIRNWHPHGFGS